MPPRIAPAVLEAFMMRDLVKRTSNPLPHSLHLAPATTTPTLVRAMADRSQGHIADCATFPLLTLATARSTTTQILPSACRARTAQWQHRWQPLQAPHLPHCSFSAGAACASRASTYAGWRIRLCWRFAHHLNKLSHSSRCGAPATVHPPN